MQGQLAFKGIVLSLTFSIAVAGLSNSESSILNGASGPKQDGAERSSHPLEVSAAENAQNMGDGETRKLGASNSFAPSVMRQVSDPINRHKTVAVQPWADTFDLIRQVAASPGTNKRGVSMYWLKKMFRDNLDPRVRKRVSQELGGLIFDYGDMNHASAKSAPACASRPSLTIAQVTKVARDSFGIADYKVTFPPCNDGGTKVSCNYDGGKCCQRPQTEFIARYYDTAVAAMALGATRDEAFAPLIHARVLAFVLQSCDKSISYRGAAAQNQVWYKSLVGTPDNPKAEFRSFRSHDSSVIAFPVAYEVLYELYNTMLIERMRSRRSAKIPTHKQVQRLFNRIYYKRFVARISPLNIDLKPDLACPSAADLKYAGLTWATSSTIAQLSRMQVSNESREERTESSGWHPALRSSDVRVTVYETRSKRWRSLDSAKCNGPFSSPIYYPYRFQERVWNQYMGCCATECLYMAMYGRTFSEHSSNCCSGCNRFQCYANSLNVADYFAHISKIEANLKLNSGPEEVTLVV